MAYSKIKISGNCDLNYVWCKTGTISDEEVNEIASAGIQSPVWDTNTILLATFKGNLSGVDYDTSQQISKYIVQKHNTKNNVVKDIAVVGYAQNRIQDYNIGNNAEYVYTITPVYDDNGNEVMGLPIETDATKVNFEDWYIIGVNPTDVENQYVVDEDNLWRLGLNIESSGLISNQHKVFVDNISQFPKAYSGKRNYLSGSLKCLIGEVNCYSEYVGDDVEKLEKWRQFCNNGQLKLLKDRKGHVIPCDIKTTNTISDDNTLEQQTTISFDFVQLADANDISVYGLAVS